MASRFSNVLAEVDANLATTVKCDFDDNFDATQTKRITEHVKSIDMIEKDVRAKSKALQDIQQQLKDAKSKIVQRQSDELAEKQDLQLLEEKSVALKAKEDEIAGKVETLKQKKCDGMSSDEKQIKTLETYVNRVGQHLGLSVFKPEGGDSLVVLKLTNIDKVDPQRTFLCELNLEGSEERQWKG